MAITETVPTAATTPNTSRNLSYDAMARTSDALSTDDPAILEADRNESAQYERLLYGLGIGGVAGLLLSALTIFFTERRARRSP